MNVPVFDLKQQYTELKEELLASVESVLAGGHFILGENVRLLEAEVAGYVGAAHGVGVANGSDALHLALMACGVGEGDEVIVPAFTFFATAGAVARAGAKPVFVDVDPTIFNIAPEHIAAAITPRTKAIIPVHLYGQSAEMEAIMAIARDHGLRVIEDAAQAIGAHRNGQPVCTFGDFGTLSFFPTKNLGAVGDAGMVVTMNAALAEQVRILRAHGAKVKYHHEIPGYNSRLDEVQAAVLRVKLKRLDEWTRRRQGLAAAYGRLLAESGLADAVVAPVVLPGNTHVFHQYTIQVAERDALQKHLADVGVGTALYYPVPLHLQPVFQELGYRQGQLPMSERLCRESLSLPMFPELTLEQQVYVVDAIRTFLRAR